MLCVDLRGVILDIILSCTARRIKSIFNACFYVTQVVFYPSSKPPVKCWASDRGSRWSDAEIMGIDRLIGIRYSICDTYQILLNKEDTPRL